MNSEMRRVLEINKQADTNMSRRAGSKGDSRFGLGPVERTCPEFGSGGPEEARYWIGVCGCRRYGI